MSRLIELRRHSLTKKGPDRGRGSQLSSEGVALAAREGAGSPRFRAVYASPVSRTSEAALAMGFAVTDVLPELGDLEAVFAEVGFHAHCSWSEPFARFRELVERGGAATRFGQAFLQAIHRALQTLPDGEAALFVSHGTALEIALVSALRGRTIRPEGRRFLIWRGRGCASMTARLTWKVSSGSSERWLGTCSRSCREGGSHEARPHRPGASISHGDGARRPGPGRQDGQGRLQADSQRKTHPEAESEAPQRPHRPVQSLLEPHLQTPERHRRCVQGPGDGSPREGDDHRSRRVDHFPLHIRSRAETNGACATSSGPCGRPCASAFPWPCRRCAWVPGSRPAERRACSSCWPAGSRRCRRTSSSARPA